MTGRAPASPKRIAGSGVPTILESGRIAANMLSKRYGLPFASHNKQV